MVLREAQLKSLSSETFDALVIGGGINGAVSAASLSARGLKVALIDKADFSGFTSANSSNLVWGGIKYLESYEFLLVNKLCKSRNLLMRAYPSSVKEIRFLTCIQKGFRLPTSLVFLGTLLYWLLGRCFTQLPVYLSAAKIKAREPVINVSNSAGGFEYSDAYLFDNDARFVFNFLKRSWAKGCVAVNYVGMERAQFGDGVWLVNAKNQLTGETLAIRSRALVNATGPFVDQLNQTLGVTTEYRHVFSKGVHLIVDRLTESPRVLTFFASDGRLFFIIPMGRKTCIGTTDTPEATPFAQVSEADRDFILANANRVLELEKPLTRADIIAERCGVRPLAVKGSASGKNWVQLSRKHVIEQEKNRPLLSIFGGKLTDCINVGDEVAACVEKMGLELKPLSQPWYGEASAELRTRFYAEAKRINLDKLTWEKAAEPLSQRFWRRYGEDAFALLEKIARDPAQANLLIENAEYTRCEIEYAREHEMIAKLEDFLRRRSKIAMVLSQSDLAQAAGLLDASRILFGDQAEQKIAEYFSQVHPHYD